MFGGFFLGVVLGCLLVVFVRIAQQVLGKECPNCCSDEIRFDDELQKYICRRCSVTFY
jgi:hypothetical protein